MDTMKVGDFLQGVIAREIGFGHGLIGRTFLVILAQRLGQGPPLPSRRLPPIVRRGTMWLDFVQESVSAEVDAMLEVVPQARQPNARADIIEVTMKSLFPVRRQPTQNPIGFQPREIGRASCRERV